MVKNYREFNISESMSWEDYSKNKDFMKFYNDIKANASGFKNFFIKISKIHEKNII